MLLMTRIPEKRKPMKVQDEKIPAQAHREFAIAVQDEYNRIAKKVEFFEQKLPKQTFAAIVLAYFLDLPEADRDRIFARYAKVYEGLARDEESTADAKNPAERDGVQGRGPAVSFEPGEPAKPQPPKKRRGAAS